jgi:hypothetical protein
LFRRARSTVDFAASSILMLWTVSLLGISTFHMIDLSVQNLFIVLLAGYCQARLNLHARAVPTPVRHLGRGTVRLSTGTAPGLVPAFRRGMQSVRYGCRVPFNGVNAGRSLPS